MSNCEELPDRRCPTEGQIRALIVPVYRNAESISALLDAIEHLARDVPGLRPVFVIDGSPDRSPEILDAELCERSLSATVLTLTRNFGAFAAIRCGLAAVDADQYAVMAADLQEPPELVRSFFQRLDTDEVDVVVGTRSSRDADPWSTRVSSRAYWSWYRRLVQRDMPAGGIDVFGCTRQVRDALVGLGERHSSLVGQLVWLGFRRAEVGYDRLPSSAGQSGWTLRRRLTYMLDSIFSFTDLPIRLVVLMGALGTILALLGSLVVFVAWGFGWISVPGYTPIMLALLTTLMLLMLSIGIVASYVWRTYENTKLRPISIVRREDRYP